MHALNHDHQVNIFNPNDARAVNVIGVGQVGSQVVDTLAHIGCSNITVWDDDEVSSHNIPMSVYWPEYLMRPKVEALKEIIVRTTGVEIKTHYQKYAGEPLRNSVIACVDTMEARMLVWNSVKRNPFVDVFIDTRLAEEYVEVFAIRPCDPEDVAFYEHFLYPSNEAMLVTCGRHGAKYIGGTAANAAVAALTQNWKQSKPKKHLRLLCGDFQEV